MKPLATLLGLLLITALWLPTPHLLGQTKDEQIAAAVLAAPEDRREQATVLGYVEGALTTLREGSNDLICLADDPSDDRFSVACYHQSLEPFMARGRELSAQGITGKERKMTRFKEIESGELAMPREGRMLYVLSGDGYDATRGEVTNGALRWVIYVPFATAEGTGMSTTPVRGAPWLMEAGTAGAHVMILPKG